MRNTNPKIDSSQTKLTPLLVKILPQKNISLKVFIPFFLKIHDYENRACHSSDISQTLSLDLHFTD